MENSTSVGHRQATAVDIPTRRTHSNTHVDMTLGQNNIMQNTQNIYHSLNTRDNKEMCDMRDLDRELHLCGERADRLCIDPTKCETFTMDEDDIFQVDEADLIRGPTLAELNANDETLLQDLNFDDILLPDNGENMFLNFADVYQPIKNPGSATFSPSTSEACSPLDSYPRQVLSPCSDRVSRSSPRSLFPCSPSEIPQRSTLTPLPGPGLVAVTRLSSSAPTHLTMEQVWQRREPRQHLLSTGSLAEAGSTSSISTSGILSPRGQDFFSQDDDSDEDSDRYEDYSSDESDDEGKPKKQSMSKKERYFWQYNVQAKGPKGQRLVLKTKLEDPHVLNKVTDPVFSPNCSIRGIKHSGKARKGDGNDLTPNPRKLYVIGKELDNLGRVINDMTPVSELPFNVRPKTRKEKNKLASRACRLKKKAQHEANKLKLYGLEHEHKRLIHGLSQVKYLITQKFSAPQEEKIDLNDNLEKILKSATKVKIAGVSSEFVNKVLDKVKSGQADGGLDEITG